MDMNEINKYVKCWMDLRASGALECSDEQTQDMMSQAVILMNEAITLVIKIAVLEEDKKKQWLDEAEGGYIV